MAKGSFGRIAGAIALALGVSAAAPAQQAGEMVFATGLEPVAPDVYAALPAVRRYRAFIPESVDLTSRFPRPGNQGAQGSCSAWAVSYAARSFLATGEGQPAGPVMSPAYVFNQTRPGPGCARGTDLPNALTFLQTKGTVPLSAFASDDCNVAPPAALAGTAERYRIGGFSAVAHRNERTGQQNADWRDPLVLDDIKGALARGKPVVIGMALPSDFKGPLVHWKQGVYRSSERFDRYASPTAIAGRERHGMALVGYDDARQAFKLLNSWDTYWGDGGYLWIDYTTFRNLAFEAYVVEAAGAPPPPRPVPPVPEESAGERLARALDQPICGKLAVRRDGARAIVEGFGDPEDVEKLKVRARGIPGVEWRVRPTPFPTCEAELMVSAGLEDGSVRVEVADATGRPLTGDLVTLKKDAFFSIDVESDAKPYIQVFYLQADGSAVELYRGEPKQDARGRRRVQVGASGATARRFQVADPFGYEALIAVASSRPVIADPLGNQATERQFLTRLKTAIVNARGSRPSAALRRLRTVAG